MSDGMEMDGQEVELVDEEVSLDQQQLLVKDSSPSIWSKRTSLLRCVIVGSYKKSEPVDVDNVSLSTLDTTAREESIVDDLLVTEISDMNSLVEDDAKAPTGTDIDKNSQQPQLTPVLVDPLEEPPTSKAVDEEGENGEAEVILRCNSIIETPSSLSSSKPRSSLHSALVSPFKKLDPPVYVGPLGLLSSMELSDWEESKQEEELGVEVSDLINHKDGTLSAPDVTGKCMDDALKQSAVEAPKQAYGVEKEVEAFIPANTKEKASESILKKKAKKKPETANSTKKEKKAKSEDKTKKSGASTLKQSKAVDGEKKKKPLVYTETTNGVAITLAKQSKETEVTQKNQADAAVSAVAVTETTKKSKTCSKKKTAKAVVDETQKNNAGAISEKTKDRAEETLPEEAKKVSSIKTKKRTEDSAPAAKDNEKEINATASEKQLDAKADSRNIQHGEGATKCGIETEANKFDANPGQMEPEAAGCANEGKFHDNCEETKPESQGEMPVEDNSLYLVGSAGVKVESTEESEGREIILGSEPVKFNASKKKNFLRWSLMPPNRSKTITSDAKSSMPDINLCTHVSNSTSKTDRKPREPVSTSSKTVLKPRASTASVKDSPKKQVTFATRIETDLPEVNLIDDESTAVESTMESLGIIENDHKIVTATVVKKSKSTKTGIRFVRRENGVFCIYSISDKGLFSKTNLKVGDRLVSVNNMSCNGKSIQDVENLFCGRKGLLTVLVKRPYSKTGVADEHEDEIDPEVSANGLVFKEHKANRTKRRPPKKGVTLFSRPRQSKARETDQRFSDGCHGCKFPEVIHLFDNPDSDRTSYSKHTEKSGDRAYTSASAACAVYKVDWKTDLAEDLCLPFCCIDDRAVDEYEMIENRKYWDDTTTISYEGSNTVMTDTSESGSFDVLPRIERA